MSDYELQRLLRMAKRNGTLAQLMPEVLRNLTEEECLRAREIVDRTLSWRKHRERVWKCKDGKRVKIKDMENEHLLNVQHYLGTKHGLQHHSPWIKSCVDEEVERRGIMPHQYELDAESKKRAKKKKGRHKQRATGASK